VLVLLLLLGRVCLQLVPRQMLLLTKLKQQAALDLHLLLLLLLRRVVEILLLRAYLLSKIPSHPAWQQLQ
jgi:hypothetical protein